MKASPEALKAIETAIQIEKDGQKFYNQAANQVDSPTGKRMFQTLARDEAAHVKLFEDTRQSLLNEGDWLTPEQVSASSPSRLTRLPIFPSVDEVKEMRLPERELDALRRGIQAEKDSIIFYSRQMEQVDDPDARAMYAFLIEQEEGHRTILEGEYDFLTKSGHWFGIPEFNVESWE
jgi:rubrerythrin